MTDLPTRIGKTGKKVVNIVFFFKFPENVPCQGDQKEKPQIWVADVHGFSDQKAMSILVCHNKNALPLPWSAMEQEAESEEKMVEAWNGHMKAISMAGNSIEISKLNI